MSPPYNPASNGAAENAVKTLKGALIKYLNKASIDTNLILERFLFDYRNTPHCTTGVAPACVMFGRRLRIRFTIILPSNSAPIRQQVLRKLERQRFYYKGQKEVQFSLGELVLVKDYRIPNKITWVKAKIDVLTLWKDRRFIGFGNVMRIRFVSY